MQIVLGILVVVVVAGLISGSGAWPMKLIRRYQFEHWWFVGMLSGLVVIPWLVTVVSCPNLVGALKTIPWQPLWKANAWATGWGVASVLCGLCYVRLGLALTTAVLSGMGICFWGDHTPDIQRGGRASAGPAGFFPGWSPHWHRCSGGTVGSCPGRFGRLWAGTGAKRSAGGGQLLCFAATGLARGRAFLLLHLVVCLLPWPHHIGFEGGGSGRCGGHVCGLGAGAGRWSIGECGLCRVASGQEQVVGRAAGKSEGILPGVVDRLEHRRFDCVPRQWDAVDGGAGWLGGNWTAAGCLDARRARGRLHQWRMAWSGWPAEKSDSVAEGATAARRFAPGQWQFLCPIRSCTSSLA